VEFLIPGRGTGGRQLRGLGQRLIGLEMAPWIRADMVSAKDQMIRRHPDG